MRNRISLAGPSRPPSAPAPLLPALSIASAQAAATRRATARGHAMGAWHREKGEWCTICDRCGERLELATGALSAAGVAAVKGQGGIAGAMAGGVVYVLGSALEPCPR
ncbi:MULTISPECIES: hypothetical protein [unclassified Mesorhizobium]|uniref:hypothetical protein n=1 Tax=unclassified Mesorhizobium TaxID=325217 RepID=UPI000FCAE7AC|nr:MULTISPECIES: hypothetical protein [unclassified Mesorhizobium]RUV63190.1 hypothetical protein EOA85_04030 [Mesorhizobium sp. M5C.F.Ca.IN.020.29.1.1]RWJ02502.1 MAG: hypothetical protein EOR23_21115 [Mesorhizobium sp.]RWJ30439.1 MAG: hypothetical protein EOR28_18300 [Mesorhizobium sp.]TIM84756.1 MAG: hypothetical protein E5Y50_21170 [Mesorhizobium sp.]TIP75388.1 MAG: hypothetical protein E5X55_04255 [Mesorhizobium sp.]